MGLDEISIYLANFDFLFFSFFFFFMELSPRFAFVSDRLKKERESGISIETTLHEFETPKYEITLADWYTGTNLKLPHIDLNFFSFFFHPFLPLNFRPVLGTRRCCATLRRAP